MPVNTSKDTVFLEHPQGSQVAILLYGATVVSWKTANDVGGLEEKLFVSSKSPLDGSKPVRGGIPIVFPCFGPPTHPDHSRLPQHGFARREIWKLDKIIMDNEAGVSVKLVLDPTVNKEIASFFPNPFLLSYVVTLTAHQLSTDLHVMNTSLSEPLEFQGLLHNYILAPADELRVTPLQGLTYYDKTESTDEARATPKTETRIEVDVKNFTDSVYENAPQRYRISWLNGGLEVRAKEFKDVVVWNPQEEGRKLVDMESEGWKKYVCLEPGYVRGFVKLEPLKTWVGQQVLSLPQQ